MYPLLSECVADSELADAIEARAVLLHTAAGRVLFRQGQEPRKLFLLKLGEVVLTSKLPNGSTVGFRAAPGSLIGLPAVAGSQPYCMTATTTKYSELHSISVTDFREIIGSNVRLSSRVLEILAAEVRSARIMLSTALASVVQSESETSKAQCRACSTVLR